MKKDLKKLRLSKKTVAKLEDQIKGGGFELAGTRITCILVGPSCNGGETCNEHCTVICPTVIK